VWSPCAHLVSRWSCPVAHSSTEQHQCQCYLQRLHPERLSKPTVYEADLDTPLAQPIRTPAEAFVRRLGWDNLKLDPEHLEERCIDALRQMGADYQIIDAPASSTDHVIIRARLNDEAPPLESNGESGGEPPPQIYLPQ